MRQELPQQAIHAAQNPKIAAALSTVTTAAGLSTILDFIPDVLGCAATMVGITLTWIMIRKGRLETKKIQLEIRILKEKEGALRREREDSQRTL